MKITHILPALIKGGAEKVVVNLVNSQINKNNSVTLIIGWREDKKFLEEKIYPLVKIVHLFEQKPNKFFLYLYIFPWLIKNFYWIKQQDLLHCHLTFGSILASFFKLLSNKKNCPAIIETYHAVGMNNSIIKRWLHYRLAIGRNAISLVAEDDYWRSFKKKFPNMIIEVIKNGIEVNQINNINLTEQKKILNKIGFEKQYSYIVGTVGMMRKERKPHLYIPIFNSIAKALDNKVHFIMIGSGPEITQVKKLIKFYNLEKRVFLTGTVLEPDLLTSMFNLYISVNVESTPGLAAMEAVNLKVPVISIQLEKNYSLKNSDWIWAHKDATEVANMAIKLLKTPSKKTEILEKQFNYLKENHSLTKMVDSYDKLYKQVLKLNNQSLSI